MPRYEVVTQSICEIDAATPEEAAAVLLRDLGDGENGVVVRHLVLWRLPADGSHSALPVSLRRLLMAFFAGVERSALVADAAFRAQVTAILDGGTGEDLESSTPLRRTEPASMAEWENEGGRIGGEAWGD